MDRFGRLLLEQIDLTIDMRVQQVTETRLEHDDYVHSLGYLEALRRVKAMMEELSARED